MPPGQSGFTSTIRNSDPSQPDTVQIGVTQAYSTSTTYIHDQSANAFTSTSGSYVVIGSPAATTTTYTTLQPGQSGYTSTLPNNVASQPDTVQIGVTQAYSTTTTYLHGQNAPGFTSTSGSYVIVGTPISTSVVCITLSPGQSAYTSTFTNSESTPDTIQIGATQSFTPTTTYLHGASATPYASTSGSYIIYGIPASTTTASTTLAPGQSSYVSISINSSAQADTVVYGVSQPYSTTTVYTHGAGASSTSSISGSYNVQYVPAQTITINSTLAPGQSGYVSTQINSGSQTDSVIYGVSQPYVTTTVYTHDSGASSSVSTPGSYVIQYVPAQTTTISSTLAPGQSSSVSTSINSGSQQDSVVYGVSQPYLTTTLYVHGAGANSSTSTSGSYIVQYVPVQTTTSTTTLPVGASGYSSTYINSGASTDSVVIGQPAQAHPTVTQTSTLTPGAVPYTQTITGSSTDTLLVGAGPHATTTSYSTIPSNSPASTQTATGNLIDTLIVLTPAHSQTTQTSTVSNGSPLSTTTITGSQIDTVVIYSPAHATTTQTTTLPAGASGFTTTSIGNQTDAVVIGTTQPYVTFTTYLTQSGATPYQSTANGTIVTGVVVQTVTSTSSLAPGVSGYTSTVPRGTGNGQASQTVIIGATQSYAQTTSYVTSAGAQSSTATTNGTIVYFVPVSTTTQTQTLPPGLTPFTSTLPQSSGTGQAVQTVVVGMTQAYQQSTSYVTSSGAQAFTATSNGTIVYFIPVSTTTQLTTLPPGSSAFTSTVPQSSGTGQATQTVIVGTTQPYASTTSYVTGSGQPSISSTTSGGTIIYFIRVASITRTSTLAPGQSPYTSTLPQGSSTGQGSQTIAVGMTQPYQLSTTYVSGPSASSSTATSNGTIIYYIPVSTTTQTSTLAPGQSGYTSTLPQDPSTGQGSQTVVIGQTQPYQLTTSCVSGLNASSSTVTSNGTIIYYVPVSTTTQVSTLAPGQSGYTSTLPQGSGQATQTVVVGISQPYQLSTSYVQNGSSSTTTTAGTIIYYVPVSTTTQTSTLAPGQTG